RMGGLPVAKHVEGVDSVTRRRELRQHAIPGKRAAGQIVQQHNRATRPTRLIHDKIAQVVMDAARRAALRGDRWDAGPRGGSAGGGIRGLWRGRWGSRWLTRLRGRLLALWCLAHQVLSIPKSGTYLVLVRRHQARASSVGTL